MKPDKHNNQSATATMTALVEDVKKILHQARQQAYSAVNSSMVQAYWLIGRRIVIDEQNGQKRAEYGKQIISTLAQELTCEFGKGFDEREIRKIRQFYLTFPIRDSVSTESILPPDTDPEKRDSLSPVSEHPSRPPLVKDDNTKMTDDNPTLGIVLCSDTDHDIARYSILKGNEQIFASKYKLYLPTEAELATEIQRQKEIVRLQMEQGGEL